MSDVHDGPVMDVPPDTPLHRLGEPDLVEVIRRYAHALEMHRGLLDELNVFPVPDGDTGSNMASTVWAVCESLDGSLPVDESLVQTATSLQAATSLQVTCRTIAHASLMGARGNSGVILSQILRGITDTLGAAGKVDAAAVASALMAGATSAYGAVGRPVEGTILTVAREAAEAAMEASNAGAELALVVRRARDAASSAVARSPQLLPALAEAGVVDAGGAGLALLFDAVVDVVDRRPVGELAAAGVGVDLVARWGLVAGAGFGAGLGAGADVGACATDGSGTRGRFEVMFLLTSDEVDADAVDAFGRAWDAIGDSVVVVGGSEPDGRGLWNCHIHTDDIGAAIEASLNVGRPSGIRVTDLSAQMPDAPLVAAGSETSAVVAVANGEGLMRIMRAQGASQVVEGGQGANPSTAQLVSAVRACRAQSVVILPDNRNIVAVADQVASVVGDGPAHVVVVPTTSVVAGLAALAAFDPDVSATVNAGAMTEAAEGVVAAEVTRALRASHCDVGPIVAGDWLGITDGVVEVVGDDLGTVVTGLVGRVLQDHHELVTLFVGAGADDHVTSTIERTLADVHPQLDVEVHHGGQPLYPYLIGIE